MFVVFPAYLLGQASVLCSSSLISFEEYQPITYPELGRRAGINANFSFELDILPGGKFDYRLLKPVSEENRISHQFERSIVSSFPGWQFVNSTDRTLKVRLDVAFELSGRVQAQDSIVKNHIAFDQHSVSIRVVATKIIPNL
jgi:hypothetical protein